MAKNKSVRSTLIFTAIFYAIGLMGLLYAPTANFVNKLSPLVILISFAIAFWFDKKKDAKLIFMLAAIGCCSFFVEYAGTHTGWIFGQYYYGKTLGPKWGGVPFAIGLTWMSLIYYAAGFRIGSKLPLWINALFSAAAITFFDFAMEPVAIRFDYWYWKHGNIPLQNYFAWFAFSFLFQFIFRSIRPNHSNAVSTGIFIIQLIFFGTLNIVLRMHPEIISGSL